MSCGSRSSPSRITGPTMRRRAAVVLSKPRQEATLWCRYGLKFSYFCALHLSPEVTLPCCCLWGQGHFISSLLGGRRICGVVSVESLLENFSLEVGRSPEQGEETWCPSGRWSFLFFLMERLLGLGRAARTTSISACFFLINILYFCDL